MQGSVRLWFSFCWKAIKSRSLLSNFSFQDSSWLTILCKQLLFNQGRTFKQTSGLIIIMLLLLLCVAKRSSSPKQWEADDSNQICYPGQADLTHTFGTPSGRSQTTVYFSFRLVDMVTLPDYRAPTSSLVATVLHNIKIKPISKREWKVYPLPGPIGY